MDEREWALLDALARLNHCSATALVERWTREKAAEEGLFEAEVERERILAKWMKEYSQPKGRGGSAKPDLKAVQAALKRMPPPKAGSKSKR